MEFFVVVAYVVVNGIVTNAQGFGNFLVKKPMGQFFQNLGFARGEPSREVLTGPWISQNVSDNGGTGGYYGSEYLSDNQASKGKYFARFTPAIPNTAYYDVYMEWLGVAYAASNNVKRGIASGGSYTTIATGILPSSLYFTDSNVMAGIHYYIEFHGSGKRNRRGRLLPGTDHALT